jgi:hypothetical protein
VHNSPGRYAIRRSDTQEIGPRIACKRAIYFFIAVVTDASCEWPGPMHQCIIFFSAPKKQERKQTMPFVDQQTWLSLSPVSNFGKALN